MAKVSVRDLDVTEQRTLIRADLNVPLDNHHRITDDRRITQFLPTLHSALERRARVIVVSHLGRPTGDPAKDVGLSLRPVAEHITTLIGQPCGFVEECVGPAAEAAVRTLAPGQVLLLENLRFHAAETVIDKAAKNPDGQLTQDQQLARASFGDGLQRLADLYVNDAFGACHRKHVSMFDLPERLGPGKRAIGFLVEKELRYLGDALGDPRRPFIAILGGAKVSDKIGVIRSLIPRVDHILIGGAMTYTFWAARGWSVGKSLCERDQLDLARELLDEAGDKLVLPVDSLAGEAFRAGVSAQTIRGELPDTLMGLDIGPETVKAYVDRLANAGAIVWNGPLGAFEIPPFDTGTRAIAEAIAQATDHGATTIIGGGDSAAAVEQAGLADRMTHISTGGGASLRFLEGKRFASLDLIEEK